MIVGKRRHCLLHETLSRGSHRTLDLGRPARHRSNGELGRLERMDESERQMPPFSEHGCVLHRSPPAGRAVQANNNRVRGVPHLSSSLVFLPNATAVRLGEVGA
jgi:hypothetical protein